MRMPHMTGVALLFAAGYFAFKWVLAGSTNAERLVALGGVYHWSALTIMAIGCGMQIWRRRLSTGSFWGDFKLMAKPLALYAVMASASVWGWNHVVDHDSTELRKSLRLAQIETQTANEEAYTAFLAQQEPQDAARFPDRQTYREQAQAQVAWMLSGGVTLALALLAYFFAAILLSLFATVLLHQIWGIATL